MPVTPEAKILEFVEHGLFKDAAAAIDDRPDCSRSLQVLRARLEAHVGSQFRAHDQAQNFLKQNLTLIEKASCLEVVGRVSLSVGESAAGVRSMRQAVALAREARDDLLETRLLARLVEALLLWVGIEQAATEIPNLRRAAFHVGDAYSLIAWHGLVAEIKGKRRLLVQAGASVDTARGLLSRFENVWQRGRIANTSAAISVFQSDYEKALACTTEALTCAERSGSRELWVPALGNLAHIQLAQQSVEDARTSLDKLLEAVRKGGTTEIAVRDIQMQVALSQDDMQVAKVLANETQSLSRGLENGRSYHGLWNQLTQVRWLYRISQSESGVALALQAIQGIDLAGDRNLLERMTLLAAEGLGRVGRAVEGAALMAEAVLANPDPPLEIMAEASRVAGRLAAVDDQAAAFDHFDRAARILHSVGNLAARADIERDAVDSLSTDFAASVGTGQQPIAVKDAAARTPVISLVERIAALVNLGAHLPLLAAETLSLIADTRAVLTAAIIETRPDGTTAQLATFTAEAPASADSHTASVRIPLGRHRDCAYEVTAIPRASAAARATLLAVERLVDTALALSHARYQQREQAALWPEHTTEQELGLVCASEKMLDLVKTVRRIATSNITVLITGETGVGKELFARALHQASARHDRTFLPFNCTTVPKDMIDSQLFGYKRGAFTGAHADSPGLIRSAAGGTLFLDEIGEMSSEAQPKLLRFLESGEILPLGESRPHVVDVRIVAATNANLDQLVTEGRFREDLYYRLNVVPLRVPPLRERREEIPVLVEYFLERHSRELQKPLMRVAEETLEYLVLHKWPGNVRQLSNEIRRMVALAEPGAVLMPEHLSPEIAASRRTVPADQRQLGPTEVVVRIDQPMAAAAEHMERAVIKRALAVCEGNGVEAAKMLGLSRKGLYLKRRRLGLE
jgi:DNA-binding NtrC family response regulator